MSCHKLESAKASEVNTKFFENDGHLIVAKYAAIADTDRISV